VSGHEDHPHRAKPLHRNAIVWVAASLLLVGAALGLLVLLAPALP
jgi:hypothetical protein